MEAEVRMTGTIFLAFLYSLILSVVTLFLQLQSHLPNVPKLGTGLWLIASIVGAFFLGISFNRLRVQEVSYTYLNLLLVSAIQKRD
jgi:hypothetical protein